MRKYSDVGYQNYDLETKKMSRGAFTIATLLVLAVFLFIIWWFKPQIMAWLKNAPEENQQRSSFETELSEESDMANFLVAGLLQASRLDTDRDGIPDYQDGDDNNDGTADALDEDDNSDGVADFHDPQTVLLSLLQNNPNYISMLRENTLLGQSTDAPELLEGPGIILEPTEEAITIATTLGSNVNLENEITGKLRAKRISHKGDIIAASNRITLSGIPEGSVLSTFTVDVNESALQLTNLSGVLPITSGGTGTNQTFTGGSVVFTNTDGTYAQDNANFFWDNALNRLGLGDSTPAAALTVGAGDLFQVNSAGEIASATAITSSGSITFSGLTANRLVVTTTGGELTNTISSANLASSVTGTTGSGNLVFATSPILVTPNLGTPSAGVLTNATGLPLTTGVTGVLPIAHGGTNSNTQTTNGVSYFNGTALVSSANLTYTGTLFSVGTGAPFQVDDDGDIVTIKGLTYSWPTAHATNGVLIDDGTGTLNWGTLGGGSITPNSLDFTEFQAQLDVDTNTDILTDGTEVLSFTNTGTGSSFLVNDEAADATPFIITAGGNVGIGEATPASLLTVGSGDVFQVNSSGAIAAATGITSSGTVIFSALTPNRLVATTTGGQLVNTIAVADLQSSVTGTTGSGNLVFATAPTITTLTVGSGGISVTGNSTIVGTLGSLTGITSSGTITFSNYTSAILLTDGSGIISEYAGTSCTNQFVRSLSPLGAATCATVQNTDLANSTVSYGGVTLSLGGSDATPAFDLADATNLPIVAGTTGTLTVARGGTGDVTFTGGILVGNGTNAFITRTITGNSQITVADGNGVSGNPTLSITADSIGDTQLAFNTGQNLTTASSPTFTGLTISSGGISVTGNSTIVGTLGSLTGLTSSGTITFSALSTAGLVTNTSGGVLGTTTTIGASYITADSLDFTEFQDQLDLDASTDILITGSQVFSLTNTGTGLSFRINDEAADTTPFVVDASGSVGIGTASPGYKLDVNGDAQINSVWQFTSAGILNWGGSYASGTITWDTGFAKINAQGSNALRLYSASSGGIDIISSGNVGIGITNPTSKLQLSASNNVDLAFTSTGIASGSAPTALIYSGYTDNSNWATSYLRIQSHVGNASTLTDTLTVTDGTVGIGTTSPTSVLTVDSAAGPGFSLRTKAGGADHLYIQLYADSDNPSTRSAYLGYPSVGSTSLTFANEMTNGDINLLPNGAGNVGIGTSSPGYKLSVTGNAYVSTKLGVGVAPSATIPLYVYGINADWTTYLAAPTTTGQSYGLLIDAGTNSSDSALFVRNASGTSLFRVSGEGNVGIGDTSPTQKLVVSGSAVITSGVLGAETGAADTSIWGISGDYPTWGMYYNEGSPDQIEFRYAGTPNSAIGLDGSSYFNASVGNVGIGTTSPATQLANYSSNVLDAAGTGSYSAGAFTWSSSGQGYIGTFDNRDATASARNGLLVKTAATDTASYIAKFESGGINRLSLRADGYVGIGTASPSTKLDVVGGNGDGIQYRTGTRTIGIGQILNEAAIYWGSGTDLTFYGGGEWMRITSAGNVGIGTNNPGAKLQVSGNVYAGAVGTGSEVRFYSSSASGTGAYGRIYADNSTLGQLNIDGGGGSAATTNTVNISAHTKPGVDNLYDLGNSSYRWRNLYASQGLITAGYFDLNHDNLAYNGDFESANTAGWSTTGGTTVTTGAYSGTYAMQVTGAQQIESSDYIPVDPDYDVLQLEVHAKKSVAGGTPGVIYLGYIAYDENKAAITTSPCGTYCYFAASGVVLPADGNWHKYSATTTGEGTSYPNFPVGTKFVRILGLINYAASSDAVTLVDHITLRRINNGPLVVGNNFASTNLSDQYQRSLIYTTASNHLILETSGNVGIGTSSPAQKLEIQGDNARIRIDDAGDVQGFLAGLLSGGQGFLQLDDGAGTAQILLRGDAGAANYINNGGNLGVGTTSPDFKLDISGDTRIEGNNYLYFGGTGSGDWESRAFSQNASGGYQINTYGFRINDVGYGGTKNFFTILNSGSVGINDVSPTTWLQVTGTNSAATNLVAKFVNPSSSSGSGVQILLGPYSDNYMASISSAGNPAGTYASDLWLRPRLNTASLGNGIYISNTDLVGIGTSNPQYKLDVHATDSVYNARFYQPSSATSYYNANLVSGAMTSAIGYFGVGGSTTGNTSFRDSFVIGTQSAHTLNLNTSDVARLTILSGGNVGIGTTPTLGHLDIRGTGTTQLFVQNTGTGTTYGADIEALGGGTSNTALYVAAANAVTNNFGIYIPSGYPPASSGNWALYIGSVAKNYFGGYIGIEDSAPNAKIALGTSAGEGIANSIRLYDDDGAQTSDSSNSYGFGVRGSDGRMSYTAGSGGYQAFFTANTERMRITSGGLVGIGTTGPSQGLLHIQRASTYNSESTSGLAILSGSADSELLLGADAANDLAYIQSAQQGTSYTTRPLWLNPNGGTVSVGGEVTVSGNLTHTQVGTGAVGVYDPAKTQAVWSMGASYVLPAGGGTTTYGSLYGLGWSYNPDYGGAGNNPQSKPGLNHQLLLMMNGVTYTALGDGIWTSGSVRSTTGINTGAGGTGTQRIDVSGNLPNTGNITFTGSNPTLSASSYMTVPGGAYFNSGTVYTEAQLRARGGIGNDTGAYLTLAGGTSGYTYASGNVGIGVTAPESPLHISGGTSMTSGWNRSATLQATFPVMVFNSNSSNWAGIGYDYSSGMRFWVAGTSSDISGTGTSAMTILDSGNVGVGTTNPQKILHSYATGSATPLRIENVDNGYCDLDPSGGLLVATCSSDRSLKSDINDTGSALNYFAPLRVRDYTFRTSGDRITGVIAQEVQQVYPDLVRTGNNGLLSVESPNPWKFVKAIQELDMITTTLDIRTSNLPELNNTVAQLSGIVETNQSQSELTNTELNEALTALLDRVANVETDIESLKEQVANLEASASSNNEEGIFENGLSVIGASFFESLTHFQDAVFFDKPVAFARDAAGTTTLSAGNTEVAVSFETPYLNTPVITVTPRNFLSEGSYKISNESENGFTISVSNPQIEDIEFSWIAIQRQEEE